MRDEDRRELEPGGPALGPLRERLDLEVFEVQALPVEQRRRFLDGEAQVGCPQLEQLPACPPSRHADLRFAPARDDDLHSSGRVVEQSADRRVARWIPDAMPVLEHEHERRRVLELREDERHDDLGDGARGRGQRGLRALADPPMHGLQRPYEVHPEPDGIRVRLLERDPRKRRRPRVLREPLREQRRLAVPGGGGDERQIEAAPLPQPLDQTRPRHRGRAQQRCAELRSEDPNRGVGRLLQVRFQLRAGHGDDVLGDGTTRRKHGDVRAREIGVQRPLRLVSAGPERLVLDGGSSLTPRPTTRPRGPALCRNFRRAPQVMRDRATFDAKRRHSPG